MSTVQCMKYIYILYFNFDFLVHNYYYNIDRYFVIFAIMIWVNTTKIFAHNNGHFMK